jgi:hypothetical protein
MRLFYKGPDGGKNSTVTGYWLFEIKCLCSIVLLRFAPGTRDVFHSHAFAALTWWIFGEVEERFLNGIVTIWKPSVFPKYTQHDCVHKVNARKTTWALSIRGPWHKTWNEYRNNVKVTLTTHRVEL